MYDAYLAGTLFGSAFGFTGLRTLSEVAVSLVSLVSFAAFAYFGIYFLAGAAFFLGTTFFTL